MGDNAFRQGMIMGRPAPVNLRGPLPGVPAGHVPRLPVGPAFMPNERVPTSPVFVDPVPNQGGLENVESKTIIVDYPTPNQEVSIWTSDRAWNGCDVYIKPNNAVGDGLYTVRVQLYAITDAGRTQVGGGLTLMNGIGGLGNGISIANPWIAGARASSVRWEVTLQVFWQTDSGAPVPTGTFNISVAAMNDLPEVPDWVGVVPVITTANGGMTGGPELNVAQTLTGSATIDLPFLEVMRVQALLNVAAPRFVQLYDLPTSAGALAGMTPAIQYAIGAALGAGINEVVRLRFAQNVRAILSNSAAATGGGLANDAFFTVFVR